MSIQSDIQKLNPGSLVELFVLDANVVNAGVFYFHAGTSGIDSNVWWQGVEYTKYPVVADGFEMRATGAAPRPKIRASNIGGILGRTVDSNDDLIGSRVTRKRTFVRYLDARNFPPTEAYPDGFNPTADPNVSFSEEIYYVDRKVTENKVMIEWELVSAMDLGGVRLPRRQIIANVCPWKYRGGECNYTGGPVATALGVATADPALDACGKRLADCKMRYGNGVLRFGGFPAAGLVK